MVEDNLVTRNGPWDGIAVGEFEGTEPSVGNVIRRNRVLHNDVPFTTGEHFTSGIVLLDVAQNTLVADNVMSQNGFAGVEILGPLSTDNVVRNNQVVGNARVGPFLKDSDPGGIRVDRGPSDNLVAINRVRANGGHGIFVGEAVENHILNNRAQANNTLGLPDTFDLTDRNPNCDANVWRGNRFGSAFPSCTMG